MVKTIDVYFMFYAFHKMCFQIQFNFIQFMHFVSNIQQHSPKKYCTKSEVNCYIDDWFNTFHSVKILNIPNSITFSFTFNLIRWIYIIGNRVTRLMNINSINVIWYTIFSYFQQFNLLHFVYFSSSLFRLVHLNYYVLQLWTCFVVVHVCALYPAPSFAFVFVIPLFSCWTCVFE